MKEDIKNTGLNTPDDQDSSAARDLKLAIKLTEDLESKHIYRKPVYGDTQAFIADREQKVIDIFAVKDSREIRKILEDLPAHFNNPKIVQAFYTWAVENQSVFTEGSPVSNRVLEAFIAHSSRPEGFLHLAKLFDDNWLGKELLEHCIPLVSDDAREDTSLSEFVYDAFLSNSSVTARIVAARFLSKLSIEKLIPSLSRDLDNNQLPVSSRCLIAEVVGNHPHYEKGAETLLKHIFPYPFDSATECFNANLGSFILKSCLGIGVGVVGVGLVELLLPKNPLYMIEGLIIGAAAGTAYMLRKLYLSLNSPRVDNQVEEVKLAAAKGIARMLSLRGQMDTETCKKVSLAIEANLDRINDHKVVGVLRQALTNDAVLADL